MEGVMQLILDGYRVILIGRIVIIYGMDCNMGGRVICKVILFCNQVQEDVDFGYFLLVLLKGMKYFLLI